jgi:large subunit ribosomal protein L31
MPKSGIHPDYTDTTFVCGCGSVHVIKSTIGGTVNIDLCKDCHPYFTGKKRTVDTAGRLDKFRAREAAANAKAA